jgi:hypothetical protein
MIKPQKYTAIKLIGLPHWLWFETTKTKKENGRFIGSEGWGCGGAFTNVDVDASEIQGEINSEALQYE